MTYTKQTWANGDVITAEKLNHMEDGIAGGTLVIGGFSYDGNAFSGTSDKTWQEIDDALAAGMRCIVVISSNGGHGQLIIDGSVTDGENYTILCGANLNATTTSADGYPSITITDN